MPWLFIPVIAGLCLINNMWLSWGPFVAVAVSCWLGLRYRREGAIATAVAWAPMVLRIGSEEIYTPARFDLALLAMGLSSLCALDSPGETVRRIVSSVLRRRLTWTVVLVLPAALLVPIVFSTKVSYVNVWITFSNLLIFVPLVLAAAGAEPKAIAWWMLAALLSMLAALVPISFPQEGLKLANSASPFFVYGTTTPGGFAMALLALATGTCIRRESQGLPINRRWLAIALAVVVIAMFDIRIVGQRRSPIVLVQTVHFTLIGALLAGVVAGMTGAALAALASLLSMALLAGWSLTEVKWLDWLAAWTGDRPYWGGTKTYLPLLAGLFGIVGAEIRAVVRLHAQVPAAKGPE